MGGDGDDDARIVPLPPRGKTESRCPTCGRSAVYRFRPFCSKRCADVDLGRWLIGSYRVPTDERPGQGGDDDDAE